jgi:hypothetical protein
MMLLAMLCFLGGARAQQALPYEYGFEDNNLATDGWTAQITSTSSGINNAAAHSGSYGFRFNYSENPGYLVSPLLTGGTYGVDVSFWYAEYSDSYGNENFQVGYTTDEAVTDPSQFTYYDDIIEASTSWQQYEGSFPAGTVRIAIKYLYVDAFYLYLDDFSFEAVSSCNKPSNLNVDYTEGSNTATVTWEGEASKYNINVNGTVTNNVTSPYTLSVVPGTTYNIKVQADCGEEQSGWVSTSFFSGCPDTYPIPYAYGFEDAGAIECWTVDGYGVVDTQDTEFARSGNNFFMFQYTQSPPQYLISPQLSGIENGLHVEFWYSQYTNGVETFQVGYSTTGNDPDNFTWGDEITASTSYQRFSANYPANTKYVAVKHTSNDQYYLFLDDFLFEESASCLEPTEVTVSNATTTGATISWTAGSNETTWDIFVTDDATVVPGETTTPTFANVTSNPYNLTGLTSCTIYYVYVRAIKGSDKSPWSSPVIFHTECEPMALPYSYDFEDDELPVSWSTINTNTSYCGVNIMAPSSSSSNRTLAFYRGSSTGTLVAVLPEVDAAYPLNGYQISFDACYANNNGGKLAIGIMTDPTDFSTFTLIEEVDITDGYSTFGSHTVMFNNYTGNGQYIAIQDIYTQSGYVLVDNVEVTALPSCIPPTDLSVTNITSNSADLSWTAGRNETAWTIYYKKATDENYNGGIEVTENPSYTLTGLDASTSYQFYVVANCSDTDTSDPSEVYTFKTLAGTVTTFPWTEDFNELTQANSIPDGWDNSEGTIPATSPAYKWCYNTNTSGNGATNGTSHDGTNCVRFNSYNPSSNLYNFLKTVPLALPDEPNMQLTFWYKNPAGGDFSVYISTDGGETHETALVTGLTGVADWTESEPINLSAYAGKTVVIVFKGTSNYGYNDAYIYLDDVTVDEVPSCAAPTHLAATNITTHTADLSWTAGGSEEEWTIYYKKSVDGNYTAIIGVDENPYTLEGLDPSTIYDYYVVANCSDIDESDPSNVYSFTTACEPYTITASTPYTQDFESPVVTTTYTQVGEVPVCWENYPLTNVGGKILAAGASYNYASSGQVLYFYGSGDGYAALPEFTNPLNELQITYKWAVESLSYGTLTLGYITNEDVDYNTFTEIISYPASSASSSKTLLQADPVDLSELPAEAARLVFSWSCSSQWGCNIDDVIVSLPGANVTFAKEGYATYYNGVRDVMLPAGMKAHVVTASDASLTYAKIADGDTDENVIPAGTAVLLQVEAAESDQTLPIYLATPSADSYAGTNLLFGSDEATETTGGGKYYKLTYSNNNDNFGWYWGADNGAAFISPAHKAWLALPASAPSFLGLPGWEDTTGIIGIDNGQLTIDNGEWYTLQGMKVGKKPTTKGVYIHNGRKVLIP